MHVPVRVIRPQTPKTESTNEPARSTEPSTEWLASADLPTRFGLFRTHVFRTVERPSSAHGACSVEHVALVFGDIEGASDLPIRIHSECITSEVFGSLKCDCKEQLDAALAEVARRGAGAVLYLRQEGRGIGLANKIRAYELQSQGADTVDANRLLGLPDDAREYHAAAHMLAHFDVQSVQVMTNNPAKVDALRVLGIEVTGRLPVVITPNAFSAGYLETKRARMAHELPSRFSGPIAAANGAPAGEAE
ncbi:MAG: 3,4-dihydroxy-2-butanone 4-phosphate synthase [Myxococcaceae bacterium]|jgi:GTP cyclohydrolase II|nr:3,4-dihydroxy-2-butanone 4-phosphate synthase [Myxococcaceae bacterium]MEA2747838.1 cyclohydrolase [Myxococcales bacterium]